MRYWLMKSEPDVYPWSRLVADGRGGWDGVRNHQAAAHLRSMAVGDQAFFYHSNEGREIVGTMQITRAAYADPTDSTGKFVMVDVAPLRALKSPVTLAMLKSDRVLREMAMLRQSRLSVSPVGSAEWKHILALANRDA